MQDMTYFKCILPAVTHLQYIKILLFIPFYVQLVYDVLCVHHGCKQVFKDNSFIPISFNSNH